uniref:Uncharacterized protein n=1 Tax=Rousettus aegyptiacus TaxID=9407 RepID=A0A7J8KAY1_ROUAE|nr:hypothetical protein HJG63_007894 [Rousettus aegyptiacus]
MSNTSKGCRDSEKGGVIRLQKMAPSGGSGTTVATSWLFGCGWLFRRPRLLSVSSVVSSLSVALHSQAAPGSWWNALSCRACSRWICLQCLPVIDSTLQRCHELSFWAAHLPLSLVVGVWLRTADHVPSPGHFHWAMMNYLAGGDDCGSTESCTVIGLHGESSI